MKDSENESEKEEKNGLSIIESAYDAGFNSKSAFNAIFKKNTNSTPSEYRKSNL